MRKHINWGGAAFLAFVLLGAVLLGYLNRPSGSQNNNPVIVEASEEPTPTPPVLESPTLGVCITRFSGDTDSIGIRNDLQALAIVTLHETKVTELGFRHAAEVESKEELWAIVHLSMSRNPANPGRGFFDGDIASALEDLERWDEEVWDVDRSEPCRSLFADWIARTGFFYLNDYRSCLQNEDCDSELFWRCRIAFPLYERWSESFSGRYATNLLDESRCYDDTQFDGLLGSSSDYFYGEFKNLVSDDDFRRTRPVVSCDWDWGRVTYYSCDGFDFLWSNE